MLALVPEESEVPEEPEMPVWLVGEPVDTVDPIVPLVLDVDELSVMLNWLDWAKIVSSEVEFSTKLRRKPEPVGNPPFWELSCVAPVVPSTSAAKI